MGAITIGLLTWFGAVAVLYLVVLPYDLHRYPLCPRCGDNLSSERRFLGSIAWCRVHGPFRPGAPFPAPLPLRAGRSKETRALIFAGSALFFNAAGRRIGKSAPAGNRRPVQPRSRRRRPRYSSSPPGAPWFLRTRRQIVSRACARQSSEPRTEYSKIFSGGRGRWQTAAAADRR